MRSELIKPHHLARRAAIYVRQSTPHQVRGNRESTVRQYALTDRAKALGWPAGAVQTIDEDFVTSRLGSLIKDQNLRQYIL